MDEETFTVSIVNTLSDIDQASWDACAAPSGSAYNPFVTHAFLEALEKSGSAITQTGWVPQHLVLNDTEGGILGALPCYLKTHSQGEYVFDYGWADAFERAGGRYYPKMQISVPFTPVTGPRFLIRPDQNVGQVRQILSEAAKTRAKQINVSSIHATFLDDETWGKLGQEGFLLRTDQQFHFQNNRYKDFDDFLAVLSSRKRKQIRRERRAALENGIEIEWVHGNAITDEHLDKFFHFYLDTGDRKWGTPYLTRSFFTLLVERIPDDLLFIFAKRDRRIIAGALNLIGSDALYGRYWGCVEDHPFLHFEICYYQAIDYAIQHGLERVEAGAQGGHKLIRGYLPVTTYSAHWIANPHFRSAVDNFLQQERRQVAYEQKMLAERAPFKSQEHAEQNDQD